MTDGPDVDRIVTLFRDALDAKLRLPKNLAKSSWLEDPSRVLLQRLYEEVDELYAELARDAYEPNEGISEVAIRRIMNEACDVAAYAAMLADPQRLRRVTA